MRGGDGPGPRGDIQRILHPKFLKSGDAEGGRDAHLLAQLLPRAGRHRKPTHSSTPAGVLHPLLRASAGRCGEIWTWGCPQNPTETDSRPCSRETTVVLAPPRNVRSRRGVATLSVRARHFARAWRGLRRVTRHSCTPSPRARVRYRPRSAPTSRRAARAPPPVPSRGTPSPPAIARGLAVDPHPAPATRPARRTRPHPSSPASPPSP